MDSQKYLKQYAEDAETCYQTAEDYYYGRNGKNEDNDEAAKWYLKAAEQGHADAQYEMGYILHNVCEGCEEEGIEWWRKAAAQGQEDAVNILKELDL